MTDGGKRLIGSRLRHRLSDPGAGLAAAALLSGVLGYVFLAAATRGFEMRAIASLSVVWLIWAIATATGTFPIEQWLTRQATSGEAALAQLRGAAAEVGVAVAIVVGVGTWLARGRLFTLGDGTEFAVLCAATVLGATAMGLARGALHGGERYAIAGALLVGENAVRVATGLAIIATDGTALQYAAVVPLGSVVALPWALVGVHRPSGRTNHLLPLGSLATGIGLSQAALAAPPILLALVGGGASAVTAMFLAVTLGRVPVAILAGVAGRLTVAYTTAWHRTADELVRRLSRLLLIAAVVSPLAAVPAWWFGPRLIELLFGPVPTQRWMLAAIATGSVLAATALTCGLALPAAGRPDRLAWVWTIAALPVITVALLPLGAPDRRVVAGFVVGQALAIGSTQRALARTATSDTEAKRVVPGDDPLKS